jgi:ribosomal protein L32
VPPMAARLEVRETDGNTVCALWRRSTVNHTVFAFAVLGADLWALRVQEWQRQNRDRGVSYNALHCSIELMMASELHWADRNATASDLMQNDWADVSWPTADTFVRACLRHFYAESSGVIAFRNPDVRIVLNGGRSFWPPVRHETPAQRAERMQEQSRIRPIVQHEAVSQFRRPQGREHIRVISRWTEAQIHGPCTQCGSTFVSEGVCFDCGFSLLTM